MKQSLFIAIPCYDTLPCETVQALLRVNKELPFPHTIRFHIGNSVVASARNALAADFLAGTWTHLLFIDADMVFTPGQIVRLLSHDEAIVGGFYPQKNLSKTSFCFEGEIEHDSSRDLMEVRHLGAGFLSIRRDVFETIIATFPAIEYISTDRVTGKNFQRWDFFCAGVFVGEDGTPRYLSEDFYFCELARAVGFKVYADLCVIPGHMGRVTFPLCEKWSKARIRETAKCEKLLAKN